jgi:hypothetical protein
MTMGGALATAELCGYLIALDTRNSHLPFEVNTHDVVFKGPAVDGIRLCRIWVLFEHCPQLVEEIGIRLRAALVFFCHGLLLSIAALVTPAVVYDATTLASGDESAMNPWRTSENSPSTHFLRILLPRTSVNKGRKKRWSLPK